MKERGSRRTEETGILRSIKRLRESIPIITKGKNYAKEKVVICLILTLLCFALLSTVALAAPGISISDDGITINSTDDPGEISASIKAVINPDGIIGITFNSHNDDFVHTNNYCSLFLRFNGHITNTTQSGCNRACSFLTFF